ncbi:YihD family protein [Escherichia coli]|nr:YihD family protein [Escherichia coli]
MKCKRLNEVIELLQPAWQIFFMIYSLRLIHWC